MEDKGLVHTIVLHPDLEALAMAWLIVTHPSVRRKLGVRRDVRFKYIPSGLKLRAEDWDGLPLDREELEQLGFLFIDCAGSDLDQHVAPENTGYGADKVASIDLLTAKTGVLETDPSYIPFIRLISENDRNGGSLCPTVVLDRNSDTPHVSRDLCTMVGALNDLFPGDPELVRNVFFFAMDGLYQLFAELWTASFDATGVAPDESLVNLRDCCFMTVDNAAIGLERYLSSVIGAEEVAEYVEKFWQVVAEAWQIRERDWRVAVRDVKKARRVQAVYRDASGAEGCIWVLVGESDSRYFSVVSRRKQCDVAIQFYSDGRFMVTRRGHLIDFDRVAKILRLADAMRRGGKILKPRVKSARRTTSIVEVGGERVEQFYYPAGGFAFGNRWATNPTGLAVSVLSPEEVKRYTLLALARRITKKVKEFGLTC